MTSMALLTYLAHGETPDEGKHPEFAGTVRKAIEYLVDSQQGDGLFKVKDGHNYSHPIAAYALSEAYALTDIPSVGEAAEKALIHVVKGQNVSGGWDYNMKQTERDDTSYMGWCAQAIKAGKMAGLQIEGLDASFAKAVEGFQKNSHSSGGFGYTSPQQGGLTGVGVLCMQLLGAGDKSEARIGLSLLEQAKLSWENWKVQPYNPGSSPIYYWYYITQAKFHAGGDTWSSWNNHFNAELVKQQIRAKGEYTWDGKPREIGHWTSPSEREHGKSEVMDTCLCALQLEVYYRYLPTFKAPAVVKEADFAESTGEIEVDVVF